MSRWDWEQRFATMASPPSDTEEEKCERAEKALRDAIANDPVLSKRNDLRIIRQGSYRNNTNVRQESDIDLALVCSASMWSDFAPGVPVQDFGMAAYTYPTFRSEVHSALVRKFKTEVTPGNKSFDVRANTYRVEADITPFFEYKYFTSEGVIQGIAFNADNRVIVNWPEQHYENGVAKNKTTSFRYKQVVRVLKSLMYELRESGNVDAKAVNGFSLECLAYNADASAYNYNNLFDCVGAVLLDVYSKMNKPIQAAMMTEVNGRKDLFDAKQKWTLSNMQGIVRSIFNGVGFK